MYLFFKFVIAGIDLQFNNLNNINLDIKTIENIQERLTLCQYGNSFKRVLFAFLCRILKYKEYLHIAAYRIINLIYLKNRNKYKCSRTSEHKVQSKRIQAQKKKHFIWFIL